MSGKVTNEGRLCMYVFAGDIWTGIQGAISMKENRNNF
jgi:hypothetical protein